MRMDLSTLLVTTAAESVPAIPTLLEINVPNVPLNILHFPLVMVSINILVIDEVSNLGVQNLLILSIS